MLKFYFRISLRTILFEVICGKLISSKCAEFLPLNCIAIFKTLVIIGNTLVNADMNSVNATLLPSKAIKTFFSHLYISNWIISYVQ